MVFGSPVKCNGCKKDTTCLFVAQYRNGENHSAFICENCYKNGMRCWVHSDGSLSVSKEKPDDSRQAVLYWDEGLYTTQEVDLAKTPDGEIVTYPSTHQPY